MANIINIDTSTNFCSVALAIDGEVVAGYESSEKMDHSKTLAPFVEKCVAYSREKGIKIDAVAVTIGPGSYTGLRIGLSLAKGLAYGMDIPLITLSSLMVMAVRAMFTYPELSGEEIIVPMIDARRMEVFTGIYDCGLNNIESEKAMILDSNSFSDLSDKGKILFIGDGTEKFKNLYPCENAEWLGAGLPHAKYMVTLSEKYFREKRFSDVAYTTPSYLKDYQATTPKEIFPHIKG